MIVTMTDRRLTDRRRALFRRLAALLTWGALLAGCSGQPAEQKVEENLFPQDYRAGILAYLREQLPDPTGIRDAFIAEPKLTDVGGGTTRYVVCLRFDPRDGQGSYSGIREMAAYYYAGRMTQMIKATPALCGKAAYQPFPELTKLCRELNCKPA